MTGRYRWRWRPGVGSRPSIGGARVALAMAIALAGTMVGPIHHVTAQTAPAFTLSHYVQNGLSNAAFSSSGCTHGRATGGYVLVVLDFGQPWVSGASYGARYWYYGGVSFLSTASIASYVESYAQGFYACGAASTNLRLAVGTNNDSPYVSAAHGAQWSAMVGSINSWLASRGYSGRITAAGAIDAEPGFSASASMTRSWMAGFGSTWIAYNFGSADGCSWTTYSAPPGQPCNRGWRQDDLYYLAWAAPAAWALPEVYATGLLTLPNGARSNLMANQWEMVRLYGSRYGSKGAVVLAGSMAQTDGLAPATSWTYLYNSVNAYSPQQGAVAWSTKIVWGL